MAGMLVATGFISLGQWLNKIKKPKRLRRVNAPTTLGYTPLQEFEPPLPLKRQVIKKNADEMAYERDLARSKREQSE